MGSFLFALNATAPIILMVVIGYAMKMAGFIKPELARAMNKLVFRFFLPAMLFLNIYNLTDITSIGTDFILYAIIVPTLIFLLAIPVVRLITKSSRRRGVMLQGWFRSNYTLVGISLAQSLFGAEGAAVASFMAAVIVPVFNILAVISLSMFSDSKEKHVGFGKIVLGILKNPLIQGVAAGGVALAIRAIFTNAGIEFRLSDIAPVMKVLTYLSNMATPLALIVLGAQFDFATLGDMKKEIILGTVIRSVIVPIIGLGAAYLLFRDSFTGAHFATLVALFATPLAVSSVPMTQEMGGDELLAGQLVVWTTIFSAFSIFFASFILSLLGIFPTI